MAGASMTSEMIAFVGSVFIAAALAAKFYQRRQDVLHGPYIEGRDVQHPFKRVTDWLAQAINSSELQRRFAQLGWKVRNVSYFASAIIC
jgi:hypothetical protein